MQVSQVWALLVRSFRRYDRSNGELLAAALAFYGMLSLAPLIYLAVAVASLVFEQATARRAALRYVEQIATRGLARQTAEVLDALAAAASDAAAVLALLTLLWAASRMFIRLQQALNAMWGIQTEDATSARDFISRILMQRLLSFVMVMGCGALLLALLVVNSILTTVTEQFLRRLPWGGPSPLGVMLQNYAVTLATLASLFAIIYRFLPHHRIPWPDAWAGATLTSILMLMGTLVLQLLLGAVTAGWVHGSLGSITAFVFWVYYQAQVFMFGVAFTREWTDRNAPAAANPSEVS